MFIKILNTEIEEKFIASSLKYILKVEQVIFIIL